MKLSRRTNTIILWIVALALVVGMVIMFTPTLGGMGGGPRDASPTLLSVNGQSVTERDLSQARQGQPLFSAVPDGPVAADLDLLLLDTVVRQRLVNQAASRQRIGNAEVRAEVDAFRARNGVDGSRNDQAYLRLIGGAGYTDQTFREYLRQQLQVQAWQDEVAEGVDVTDAEVETFYAANRDAYRTEPRVLARQIVTDERAEAEALRERALAGEAFADLAAEASLEGADRGGAVGGDEPRPVGRPAFPSAVGQAVFQLSMPGLTPVVEAAGRYYLVDVIERIAAEPRPLDEVREQVRADALEAKRQAALDARVDELRRDAEIEIIASDLIAYDDAVVARVGEDEIRRTELVRATYANPQIQQALGPQTASLIHDFFKPSILQQLVDQKLAARGASELGASFFGGDALVAQGALDWVARDAEASEERIEAYYQANLERYTVPASAEVLQVEFDDEDAAFAYREAILDGADPLDAAAEADAETVDHGSVERGELETPLDTALFDTDAFEALPSGPRSVSDVLVLETPVDPEAGTPAGPEVADEEAAAEADAADAAEEGVGEEPEVETRHVVLVALRVPAETLPLDQVRQDVESIVLSQERQRLQREWLDELRAGVEVEILDASLEADAGAPFETVPGAEDGALDDGATLDLEDAIDVDDAEEIDPLDGP